MQYHKKWLYSVNFLLFLLVVAIFCAAAKVFNEQWMSVFRISRHDYVPEIYVALLGFQLFACICGLVGTCTSRIAILKIFWILIISLVIADILMINPVAGWMSEVHKEFTEDVATMNTPNCTLWKEISQVMDCCPDTNIIKKCRNLGYHLARCLPTSTICTRPLLQWLHNQADHIALLIYFLLLPLKCLIIFVLREHVRRIFFIQEVSGDYDEADDEYTPTYKRYPEISPLKEVTTAPQRLYGG